jgi:hypothetical protein
METLIIFGCIFLFVSIITPPLLNWWDKKAQDEIDWHLANTFQMDKDVKLFCKLWQWHSRIEMEKKFRPDERKWL